MKLKFDNTAKTKFKNRLFSFLEFLSIFLIIIFNFDCFLVGSLKINLVKIFAAIVPFIVIALLCLILIDKIKNKKITIRDISKTLAIFFAFSIFYIITFIFNIKIEPYLSFSTFINSMEYMYAYQFLFTFLSAIVILTLNEKRFYKIVCIFTFLSSCCGLVLYVIANYLPSVYLSLPAIRNSTDQIFRCFGLAVVNINVPERIFGFSREPGVFSLYLFLSLYYLIFIKTIVKKNLYDVFFVGIFLLTSILTRSTTCYLSLFLMFLAFIFNNMYKPIVKYIIVLLFIAVIALSFNSIKTNVFEKIFNLQNTSTLSRLLSIPFCIIMLFLNPFAGIGWSSYKAFYNEYSTIWISSDFNITNTILFSFSIYGIAFGVLTLLAVICFFKNEHLKKIDYLFLTFALVVCLFCENLLYSSFYIIIVFYSLNKSKLFSMLNENKIGCHIRLFLYKAYLTGEKYRIKRNDK